MRGYTPSPYIHVRHSHWRASLSSTHTLLSESGTQWGQAAAEREWGHSLSAISTKENGTFRGMGVLFEVTQGEMGRPAWVNEIEQVRRGQGGCNCVHVCTLHNEQSRYIAYLHSVIIQTRGQICERYVMGCICDYNLIRRQQLRSYLSQVHLFHLSCILITAVIWGILSIVLEKNLLWSVSTCHCCLMPCDVFVVTFKNRMKSWRGKKQHEAGGDVWGWMCKNWLRKATLMQKNSQLEACTISALDSIWVRDIFLPAS